MHGNISDPGMGPYPTRVELALQTPRWGFHTVLNGIDPGDHCFCYRFAGVVDIWNDF